MEGSTPLENNGSAALPPPRRSFGGTGVWVAVQFGLITDVFLRRGGCGAAFVYSDSPPSDGVRPEGASSGSVVSCWPPSPSGRSWRICWWCRLRGFVLGSGEGLDGLQVEIRRGIWSRGRFCQVRSTTKFSSLVGGRLKWRSLKMDGVSLAGDRKSTRLNSSHSGESRMPSSA